MAEERKVLIIGIDGGTWDVLQPAIDEGYMPNLAEIVSQGAAGVLESTIPAITPAAWSSFQTGQNPGRTGIFDFTVWDKTKKDKVIVHSQTLGETMWETAGKAGKRVGVLNVPITYPPRKVNGFMVSGLMTPSTDSGFTYPASLKKELLENVPDYDIHRSGEAKKVHLEKNDHRILLGQMRELVDMRTRAAKYLISREPLDLFMVHFVASDKIQHSMWGYLDSGHELFDEKIRKEILGRFYTLLDEKIQEVMDAYKESVGEHITLFVSDHGFQAHRKRFNLALWLHENGYMRWAGEPSSDPGKKPSKPLWKRALIKMDVLELRKTKMAEKVIPKTEMVKWEDSCAFSIGQSNEGFVYLLPEDDKQREALAEKLEKELLGVKEGKKGVISCIYRKEDVYSGKYMDIMPDLVLDPGPGYSCTGNIKPDMPMFHKVNPADDYHIGKHHRDGIIIAHGPGIEHTEGLRVSIMDVAPTVLGYLGVEHEKKDGRYLTELFTAEDKAKPKQRRAGKKQKKEDDEPSEEGVYSDDDEALIKKRLEELGYF